MIKSDNLTVLEKKIINLFINSNDIPNKKLENNINLFAELYIYIHFFYNISNERIVFTNDRLDKKEKINKKIKYLFTCEKIKDIKFRFIKNFLNLLYDFTCKDVDNMDTEVSAKYIKMEKSIIRKLKIQMILKKGE